MQFEPDEQIVISQLKQLLSTISDSRRKILIAKQVQDYAYNQLTEDLKARRRTAYLKKKTIDDAGKPQVQFIAKLSLGNGNLIRLKGTRDSGIREVIHLDGTKITCYQLRFKSTLNWSTSSGLLSSYARTGFKTTHDLSKITHVSENGDWKNFTKEWFNK